MIGMVEKKGKRNMRWTNYPKNRKVNAAVLNVIEVFEKNISKINSASNTLKSNEVLAIVREDLMKCEFLVEKGKSDKIRIPVMYEENGVPTKTFEVDALNERNGIVVEVEAGRAYDNYQFLKDLFEACCMEDIKYVCIAVREVYRGGKDYEKVIAFLDAVYASDKFKLPLEGVTIIGY
ncbi:MAG: hypothetical protein Q4F78_00720 [Bacillota bacterium]|nr:hypothetical protein [Bacillota bacterium]